VTDARNRSPRALVHAPYWFALGDHVDRLEEVIEAWHPRLQAAVGRSAVLRSMVTAWLARRYAFVVADYGVSGPRLAFWVALLAGRQRLVWLNYHTHVPVGRARDAPIRALRFRLGRRLQFRRAVLCAQALSLYDRDLYRDKFNVADDRITYSPYAWRRQRDTDPGRSAPGGRRVLACGRAACDWETLFAAARDADWDLTVVCGEADLERVRRLNRGATADVKSEIPPEEYVEILEAADVLVIPIREDHVSTGHVRLRDANEAGVPVVAADVHALREYVVDGTTALLYSPGDARRLRERVDELLAHPDHAERIAANAVERSQEWTSSDLLVAQRALVEDLLGLETEAARSARRFPRRIEQLSQAG